MSVLFQMRDEASVIIENLRKGQCNFLIYIIVLYNLHILYWFVYVSLLMYSLKNLNGLCMYTLNRLI